MHDSQRETTAPAVDKSRRNCLAGPRSGRGETKGPDVTSGDRFERAGGRTRVLVTAQLFAPNGLQTVRVSDISGSGARVATEVRLPSHGDVIIKRGSLFAAARITWTEGKYAGLRFYRKLSVDELASIGNRTGHSQALADDAFAA